jgi:predicted thioredoxin/glutaredoxin
VVWKRENALSIGKMFRWQVWVTFCRFIKSDIIRLADDASVTLLEKIIATSTMPSAVILALTTSLVKDVLDPASEAQIVLTARRLLSLIQPRHPSVLQKVAETLSEADESSNDALEQLVISLSMVTFFTSINVLKQD